MVNLRIYVGTYKKYNEGSLFGKWIDLNDFSSYEQFLNAIQLLHNDEQDPEFMFQDYECSTLFEQLGLISECHLSKEIFTIMETIENSRYDIEIIETFCSLFNYTDQGIDSIIESIEDSYIGEYDNDIQFVQECIENTEFNLDKLPSYIHIDWQSTARDIMFDYSSDNDFYFRNI